MSKLSTLQDVEVALVRHGSAVDMVTTRVGRDREIILAQIADHGRRLSRLEQEVFGITPDGVDSTRSHEVRLRQLESSAEPKSEESTIHWNWKGIILGLAAAVATALTAIFNSCEIPLP